MLWCRGARSGLCVSWSGASLMNAVLMFEMLVPSARYNLSDDQIAYQVCDRLSFMRFLGLGPWGPGA
jgi:IS5 family transposase